MSKNTMPPPQTHEPEASSVYIDLAAKMVAEDSLGADWIELPLDPYGTHPLPQTDFLKRDDDRCLFYRGKHHALIGESESMKSWIACLMVAAEITLEHHAVYVDFEDSRETFEQRLLALRCRPDEIESYAHYLSPTSWPRDDAQAYLRALCADLDVSLVILDGVTEAFALMGGDPNHSVDVAKWQTFVRATFRAGDATTCEIDHPGKDKSRGAAGSIHKRAGIDGVQFTVSKIGPALKRDGMGRARLTVTKDRPGAVRAFAEGNRVADVIFESSEGGVRMAVRVVPPGSDEEADGGSTLSRVMAVMSSEDELTVKEIVEATNEFIHGEPLTDKAVRSALNRADGDLVISRSVSGKASLWRLNA